MSEFLTAAEAAERAGVDVSTVRRWIRTGQLDGVRMGPKLLKVRTDVLEKFMGTAA